MGKSIFLVITAAYVEGQVIHQLTVTVTFKIPVEIDALMEVFGDARPKTTYIHNHMKRRHFTKDTRSTVLNTTDHESQIIDQEDTRKHTEDHPLIATSLNHMTMIITVLTTMKITHTMANILNSILMRYGSQK